MSSKSQFKAVRLPNALADQMQQHVKAKSYESDSAFIKAAIREKLQREGYKLQA
ncbi:ribbon-helix-helix domain-containing protein [Klebsiella pneumoniae]|uniref:ribbon-helix-helix domain-containing protein n=1 Tax=Klebsiella pneumoniae TaxID=573 RepID=UPI003527B933